MKPSLPFPLGTPVRYYDNGWRVGHFEGIEKGRALVRPIRYGRPVRPIRVPLDQLEKAT